MYNRAAKSEGENYKVDLTSKKLMVVVFFVRIKLR